MIEARAGRAAGTVVTVSDPTPTRHPDVAAAVGAAEHALLRAVYLLDRELAPAAKVRAFLGAIAVIRRLDPGELVDRVGRGTLTELDGIGPSTASVIGAAVRGEPSRYLDELDARSRVECTVGAKIRAALVGECHLHTTWSDGGASVAAMAEAARSLGHRWLVVTDHSPRLRGVDPEALVAQRREIDRVNEAMAPFRVLRGVEVDILVDGSLDLPAEVLAELELVVASVHSKFSLPPEEMTRRLVTAIADPRTDVIGHPTNRKVAGRWGKGRAGSSFDPEIVMAACARFDTALELNCRPERQDPPDEILELAASWGVAMAIDSDAHAPGQLEWQAYGCDRAVLAGIDQDRVVNTWDCDRVLGWTRSHRG